MLSFWKATLGRLRFVVCIALTYEYASVHLTLLKCRGSYNTSLLTAITVRNCIFFESVFLQSLQFDTLAVSLFHSLHSFGRKFLKFSYVKLLTLPFSFSFLFFLRLTTCNPFVRCLLSPYSLTTRLGKPVLPVTPHASLRAQRTGMLSLLSYTNISERPFLFLSP